MGIPGEIGPQGLRDPKERWGRNEKVVKWVAKGSTGTPGNIGPRGLKGSKGDSGSMGLKRSSGIPGNTGPRGPGGFKGEIGLGTKGEKGDAANMDPRQKANWKQCTWRRESNTDNCRITVSHLEVGSIKLLALKRAVYMVVKFQ